MIVCADDFGMAGDIDTAVLELAAQGKVTAISCAVAHAACAPAAVERLAACGTTPDVGLHLVLTAEADPLSPTGAARLAPNGRFRSFSGLLRLCFAWGLAPDEPAAEIASQYARFVQWAGRAPDFIDSHLHVHQFPGIREALFDFLAGLHPERRPWVRNSSSSLATVLRSRVSVLKNLLIAAPGSTFRRLAHNHGLSTNAGFAGIYDYTRWRSYPAFFDRFVAGLPHRRALLMTHPGLHEGWRRMEYETLLRWKPEAGRLNRFGAAPRE